MIKICDNILKKNSLISVSYILKRSMMYDQWYNGDDEEKFGDLSRPLGDQFTHPGYTEHCKLFTHPGYQCTRVGCGIKMVQERYTAQISVPTTVVQQSSTSPTTPQQWRQSYPTMLRRQDYVPCARHVPHYLPPISLSWSNLTRDKLKKP